MKNIWFCLLAFILFSCNSRKEQKSINSSAPKAIEAKGYLVPKDSMATPKVILVDESKLKKVPAGKPRVVTTNTNVHPAGKPKVVKGGRI
jgi:hypothetical protein